MELKTGINIFDYEAKMGLGITFKSKSIILKLESEIVVISPADFNSQVIEQLKNSDLKLSFISPNNFHHLHLKKMKELFPDASFYGPGRSEKLSGVSLVRTFNLTDIQGLEFKAIEGAPKLSETCFFHSPSKTLIVTDLLFNMRHEMNFMTKTILKIAGAYHKLGMSKLLKSLIEDEAKFYNSIKELMDYDFNTVILNHGNPITRREFENFFS